MVSKRLGQQLVKLTLIYRVRVSPDLLALGSLHNRPWPQKVSSVGQAPAPSRLVGWRMAGPRLVPARSELFDSSGSIACRTQSIIRPAPTYLRVSMFARGSDGIHACLYYSIQESCRGEVRASESTNSGEFSLLARSTRSQAFLYLYGPTSGRRAAEYSQVSVNAVALPPSPIILVSITCSAVNAVHRFESLGSFLEQSTDSVREDAPARTRWRFA